MTPADPKPSGAQRMTSEEFKLLARGCLKERQQDALYAEARRARDAEAQMREAMKPCCPDHDALTKAQTCSSLTEEVISALKRAEDAEHTSRHIEGDERYIALERERDALRSQLEEAKRDMDETIAREVNEFWGSSACCVDAESERDAALRDLEEARVSLQAAREEVARAHNWRAMDERMFLGNVDSLSSENEALKARVGRLEGALLFGANLFSSHRYNWEHDGDEESGQHDEDCGACEYEAMLARFEAALASRPGAEAGKRPHHARDEAVTGETNTRRSDTLLIEEVPGDRQN